MYLNAFNIILKSCVYDIVAFVTQNTDKVQKL